MLRFIHKGFKNPKERFEEMSEAIADETEKRVHHNLGHHHTFNRKLHPLHRI